MLDTTLTTPACPTDAPDLPAAYLRPAPPMPPRVFGSAAITPTAPHAWQVECVEFIPATKPEGGLLGFARFLLPGGMLLGDTRIVRLTRGLRVTFPRRCAMAGGRPARRSDGDWMMVAPVDFPRRADFEAFSAAALAPLERFAPGALSNAYPDTATPPCAAVAPAMTRN